jgi:hypothetical protein
MHYTSVTGLFFSPEADTGIYRHILAVAGRKTKQLTLVLSLLTPFGPRHNHKVVAHVYCITEIHILV